MVQSGWGYSEETTGENRLSAAIAGPSHGLHSLAALPSNIEAIEGCLQFANGHRSFVALFGPSGWGKSRMVESVAQIVNSCERGPAALRSCLEWTSNGGRADANRPLVLDDCQDVLRHPRARHVLRQGLERRFRQGKSTLVCFTAPKPTGPMRALLPCQREWLVTVVSEPTLDERDLIVRRIAAQQSFPLNREVARLIARHLNGNGRSILGAIQRLKLVKADWSSPNDVVQACGVLSPYLIGHEGWDPRDHVFEAVARTVGPTEWGSDHLVDICCYLLLCEMGLSEREVSTFLGLSPSVAYSRAVFIKGALAEPATATAISACRIAVLREFERV